MMPRSPYCEWDWPPQRARPAQRGPAEEPPTLNARIVLERVVLVKPRVRGRNFDHGAPSGWASPRVRKAVAIYCWIVITIIKVMIAIPLTIMTLGSFWLIWAMLTGPKP
jgi:hypothetical protein